MTDRDDLDVLGDVIHVLREEGHDTLADEFAETCRDSLRRHRRILTYLKIGLGYLVLVGGALVTVVGFGYMISQGDPVGALIVLVLGAVLYAITILARVLVSAFEEHVVKEYFEEAAGNVRLRSIQRKHEEAD